MKIEVSKSTLFLNYLLWLDPVLRLTKIERGILASVLTMHYNHIKDISDPGLSEMILSEESLVVIRKKLRLGKNAFTEGFVKLKQKGYLTDDGIALMFTNYPPNGQFKLNIEFEVK